MFEISAFGSKFGIKNLIFSFVFAQILSFYFRLNHSYYVSYM